MRASRAKVATLQDTATTSGILLAASCVACACAPWRGGSNTTASIVAQFLRHQRTAEQVARLGLDRLQSRRRRRRLLQRRDRAGLAVEAPQPSTWPPAAARTVRRRRTDRRYVWRACSARLTSAASASSPAIVACRNEPGGRVTRAAPIVIVGGARISTNSPWRVSRASRCCSATRDSVVISLGRQRSGAAHVDIETAFGGS